MFCLTWLALTPALLAAQQPAHNSDASPHQIQFVTVEPNVKLEVLDWGGSGRPIVLLSGLGGTAHDFDGFAVRLVPKYHVYGITRRGFGASSAPIPSGDSYSADRLADDVLTVLHLLNLKRPVLVGHSIAGQELSSIGSRFPDKVAGLIYLDAGYSYALYSPALGDTIIDAKELHHQLDLLFQAKPQNRVDFSKIEADTARFDKDLKNIIDQFAGMPAPPSHPKGAPPPPPIMLAILNGEQKYTSVRVPVLTIFADPHEFKSLAKKDPTRAAALRTHDEQATTAQAKAFQAGIPQAHVVLIPDANHFIYTSNTDQVIREMTAFIGALPH